jgi:hypothetical protein
MVSSFVLILKLDDGDALGVCVYCTIGARGMVFNLIYLVAI